MRVYLAGPMRGIEQYNFPAFAAATERLRWIGHDVISPAEMDLELGLDPTQDLPDDFDITEAMRRDIAAITTCHGIVRLPGWERSEGVRHELAAANACGVQAYDYDPDALSGLRRVDEDDEPRQSGDVRVVDPETGGEKGQKLARFDLIPWDVMHELAEHYGRGAAKYEDRNWERGYRWSLSFAALMRHLADWWEGENLDEDGNSNIVAVIWHAVALRWYQLNDAGTDDRPEAR